MTVIHLSPLPKRVQAARFSLEGIGSTITVVEPTEETLHVDLDKKFVDSVLGLNNDNDNDGVVQTQGD